MSSCLLRGMAVGWRWGSSRASRSCRGRVSLPSTRLVRSCGSASQHTERWPYAGHRSSAPARLAGRRGSGGGTGTTGPVRGGPGVLFRGRQIVVESPSGPAPTPPGRRHHFDIEIVVHSTRISREMHHDLNVRTRVGGGWLRVRLPGEQVSSGVGGGDGRGRGGRGFGMRCHTARRRLH
jgi:hypothetical protein